MSPVSLGINIEPLRRLSTLESGFDILSPETTAHLLSLDCNAMYTVYKIIYYDYAPRFKIWDLHDLVTSTFKDCWNLHLPAPWFRFLVLTQRGTPGGHVETPEREARRLHTPSLVPLTDDNQTIMDFLNQHFPY